MLLLPCVACSHEDTIADADLVQVTRADYHAYDNAWSVYLRKQDGYEHEVLIAEICRPPCAHVLPSAQSQLDCAALASSFNDARWYNAFASSQARNSSQFCDSLRSRATVFQNSANRVLDAADAAGADAAQGVPLVRLRAPLVLVIYNEEQFVRAWTAEVRADVVAVTVRITQVAPLQSVFVVHRSILTVHLTRPAQSILTLSVQNPCTALGLSAPAFASVASVSVRGRQRCMWNCRSDRIRKPYNSAPPTREEMNASSPQHAALPLPYACLPLPPTWSATLFELTLESNVIPSDSDYAQTFYDALDRFAASAERNLTLVHGGSPVVLLAVRDSIYHPVAFEQWARDLSEAACAVSGCAVLHELVNPHFFYQRRRLLAAEGAPPGAPDSSENLVDVRVEGVCVSTISALLDSEADRLQLISDLRGTLAVAHREAGADAGLVLKNVVDVDFSRMLFVGPASPAPPPPPPPAPPELPAADGLLNVGTWVALAIGVAVAVIFAVVFGPRLCLRVRSERQ